MNNPPSPSNSWTNGTADEREVVPEMFRHSYTLKAVPSQIFYIQDQQSRFNSDEYNSVRAEINHREQPTAPALISSIMQAPARTSSRVMPHCRLQCCTDSNRNCDTMMAAAQRLPLPIILGNKRVY